jgi:hypothetical protein
VLLLAAVLDGCGTHSPAGYGSVGEGGDDGTGGRPDLTGEGGETGAGGAVAAGGVGGTGGTPTGGVVGTAGATGGATGQGGAAGGAGVAGVGGEATGLAGAGGTGGVAGAGGLAGAAGAAGSGGVAGTAGVAGGLAGAAAAGTGGGVGGGLAGAAGGTESGGASGTTGVAGAAGEAGASAGSGGVAGSGAAGTGGVAGSGAAGTAGATACTLDQPHIGTGSFTYYWLGQRPQTEPPGYRTACGYYATESSGMIDTVENIANTGLAKSSYFAAIPGQNGFDTRSNCGACVQISGPNGKTIIATIVDECPYGSDGSNPPCADNPAGHLDLSYDAFQQLGFSRGDPTATSWRIVPCPVTGNVKVRFKAGSFETVLINGITATRQKYGAWQVGSTIVLPAAIHTVDRFGRTLDFTLGSSSTSNQDTGQRSPSCQ